jgi:ribulose-phosphate 3-epimerase
MIHIAPSILDADFTRLGDQVLEVERAGAQRIQLDVMDGHFVPNLSMGPHVLRSVRAVTRMPLEVHLMIEEPAKFIDAFVKAGADSIIFHYETVSDAAALIRQIRGLGKLVGVAIKPGTAVEVLEPLLPEIDLALCMTVHPGFGGQSFLPESPGRISRLRQLIQQHNPKCELEVDGGIDAKTVPTAVQSGANVLVIGSAIYRAPEGPTAAMRKFHNLIGQ